MTLTLSTIPDAEETTSTEKTSALTGLGALAKRRTVLRGMALSGATVGAVALGWSPLSKASTASAIESSPTGLTGWDANDCKDGYPNGYAETKDTEGAYVNEPAACYGGYIIGSTMCDSYGWHKSGSKTISWVESVRWRPISSACGATTTKNSWRWTVNGTTYRCSDGISTYYYWGWGYSYLTICRAKV